MEMVEDAGLIQENPSNACCEEWRKKHAKLLEKHLKVKKLKDAFKNEFGRLAEVVPQKYDAIEKEKANLKKAFDELKVQANTWKDEKEKLENEVSALKDEVRLLKCKGNSGSQEANDQLQERLNVADKEVKELKELLNMERRKAVDKDKEINAVKSKLALEKSKSESAYKQVEIEKQKAIRERERANLEAAKAEEQCRLAEMNLKKAMSKKDRADSLNHKFEEASNRANKLEEENRILREKLKKEIDAMNIKLASEKSKSESAYKQVAIERQNAIRERERADLEVAKAEEQCQLAEMAREQKHRADELSIELDSCKLRLEELQTELVKAYSYRVCADNSSLRYSDIISDTDIVEKLKNQLKLERMLANAKRVSELEAIRNNMLHQELIQLRQDLIQCELRCDMLSNSFLHSSKGVHQLEKIGNHISKGETLCSDDCHGKLISVLNSGLDPPHRGSNQNMLQSSVINSSSASFSDQTLVGSQERRTLSVASAKLGEDMSKAKPKSTLSAKSRMRHNEPTVVKADNTMKSSVTENANKTRNGFHETERILDAVKSIQNLHCEGNKLMHGILNGQKDEPEEEKLKDKYCKDLVRPFKRRKTYSEGTIVRHSVQDSEVGKSILDSDVGRSNACMAASPQSFDAMKFDPCAKDGTKSIFASKQCNSQYFDMMIGYDYMKLLDLDNAADENSYRRAMAMPLSPLLPDIELHVDESPEVDNAEMLLDKSSPEGLTGFRNSLELSSSFHADSEKKGIDVALDGVVSSQLHEGSINILRSADTMPACDTEFLQNHVSGGKLRVADLTGSGSKEANRLCESRVSSPPDDLLKYYVVHSDNKDKHSILKIVQTIGSCVPQCFTLDSAEIFVQSVLHTLLKAHDLSMKEKVCVFFSLILHGISEVGIKNWSNVLSYDLVQALDSVTLHICSALTDPILTRKFMESCDLFELLALIEDFLLTRKVFVSGDISSEPGALSSSKVDVVLNGDLIMLSEVVASAPLLVAGGSILASFCLAGDHIACICELSCNIITMQKCDPAVILAVLHTFAHVCGSKYFILQQYSLAMAVIKLVVMCLEKKTQPANSTTISPPLVGDLSVTWSCCSNCPFTEVAVPAEDVALMLLENLNKLSQSVYWPEDSFEVVYASGLMKSDSSSSACDEKLCEFMDILSLMEVLASFMSWNWVVDHLIGELCGFLESNLMKGFSAAIIILLGQLGRLGVDASGYDDPGVKKLREWLSAFLCKTSFTQFSLPVQFAIVTSLFCITSIKFEEVVDYNAEMPALSSQCIPAGFIREWFSLLSHEQRSLFKVPTSCNSNQVQV